MNSLSFLSKDMFHSCAPVQGSQSSFKPISFLSRYFLNRTSEATLKHDQIDLCAFNIHKLIGKEYGFDEKVVMKIASFGKEESPPRSELEQIELTFNRKNWKELAKYRKRLNKNSSLAKGMDLLLLRHKIRKKCDQVDFTITERELYDHFEDLCFLFDTRLIYNILGYKNSIRFGTVKHQVKFKKAGRNCPASIQIKVDGEYTDVRDIQRRFKWDETEGMLYLIRDGVPERWNYIADEGLVPVDRFFHHEELGAEAIEQGKYKLKSVMTLSPHEMKRLQQHALEFDPTRKEENREKPCVLQIVTNPRGIKDKWLKRTLSSQIPLHVGIRMITADGSVYSTGFGSTLVEDNDPNAKGKWLASINGQPTIMDYEEMRPHEGRIVTSLPVSEDILETILTSLNNYRKDTVRFNIKKQNCALMSADVLKMAGIDVKLKTPLDKVIRRAFFGMQPIQKATDPLNFHFDVNPSSFSPGINRALEKVKRVASLALLPYFLFFRPVWNLLLLAVITAGGGGSSTEKRTADSYSSKGDLEDFKNIMPKFADLFTSDLGMIQHSTPMVRWQLAQHSTYTYSYTGQPQMGIVPPKCSWAKDQSLKEKFEKVFRVRS